MAQIGNLGSLITFEVSSNKVLTFDKMQRTVKGRWAQHEVIGGKPVSEYLGPGQQQITFTVFLSSAHGVKPRKIVEAMEQAVENGTPFTFVIGGKKVGSNQWVIESISETWGEIIDSGSLLSAHLTLTLSEYAQ